MEKDLQSIMSNLHLPRILSWDTYTMFPNCKVYAAKFSSIKLLGTSNTATIILHYSKYSVLMIYFLVSKVFSCKRSGIFNSDKQCVSESVKSARYKGKHLYSLTDKRFRDQVICGADNFLFVYQLRRPTLFFVGFVGAVPDWTKDPHPLDICPSKWRVLLNLGPVFEKQVTERKLKPKPKLLKSKKICSLGKI